MPDLPDLPGPARTEPHQPTAVHPAPTPAAPAGAAPATVLIGARTIPTETPDPADQPKPPRRTFAEHARARKLRHGRRRAQRAAAQHDDPVQDDDALEEPADEPTPRRQYTHRRQRHPRGTRGQRQHGRLKTLLVTATGAGIGWQLGLGPGLTGVIHQIGHASPGWAVGAGATAVAASAYLDFVLRGGRSHDGAIPVRCITSWGLVFAVIARVPLGTALLALCLYAPGRI